MDVININDVCDDSDLPGPALVLNSSQCTHGDRSIADRREKMDITDIRRKTVAAKFPSVGLRKRLAVIGLVVGQQLPIRHALGSGWSPAYR